MFIYKFKDLIKVYRLTQNTSNEHQLVFDFESDDNRNVQIATDITHCQLGVEEKTTQGWTSRNKDIDNCLKDFQLRANSYEKVIEWIPFDKLNNIENIGKGGFGSVFSAFWLDGI